MHYLEIKILILDDDEDDFIITSDYIRAIAGNTFSIDWCSKYEEGLKHLHSKAYHLYFVDYRLGAKTGIDFLIDANKNNCDEPIVLLTGMGNYNIDMQSMQYGAVDYLVKTELTTEKIERCIRYALDRYATLQALKAKESKYRSIFEKSKDVVFVTDCHLNFIDVNPAINDLLGYEKENILSKNINYLFEKEQPQITLPKWQLTNNEINDKEVVFITQTGEKKYCTLSLIPEDATNPNSNIQGIIHDITNLKVMERVTIQTEKLAAAGRLLRTIAHEVRNPLNNITLSAEQLLIDLKDQDLTLYLDIIQRNSKRISELITELLNTSLPNINKQEAQNLQHIIDAVIAAAIDRLTLKQIELVVKYPENTLLINADSNNLKLALLNIVINAIESMTEGAGQLIIKLEQEDNKGILSITDNGTGISEDHLTRLFEPYFTQKRNGIGLGLTFTLSILQSHHAQINVTSSLGKGTTFTIKFNILS